MLYLTIRIDYAIIITDRRVLLMLPTVLGSGVSALLPTA